ncbi:MAG: hypothetical protein GTO03_14335 [Planctomycetales bacterium]|nr:hypothetical protein [Planctomycetales bacterium]
MKGCAQIVARLAAQPVCGYHAESVGASEPTALTALGLLAWDRPSSARLALDWLLGVQAVDGSVGVTADSPQPGWPTALAVIAWQTADRAAYRQAIQRATAWILGTYSHTFPRPPELGHDTTLKAWPWVAETHGWVEPTAMHVLALKSTGYTNHARTRSGVRMLKDRLLPSGGCNVGNTVVLGGTQRPHLMPTGLALLALAGESPDDAPLAASLDYAARAAGACRAVPSLCYAAMALQAHRQPLVAASARILAALDRQDRRRPSPYPLALASLALAGEANPLVSMPSGRTRT